MVYVVIVSLSCSLSLQYKGQVNLHIFEDWCGSSTAQLRKNLHYPLYPHSRTTVKKLAVSPRWTNYGLRIFGYLHPYTDGEFVFAVSSDDNSEFWLSRDDSPLNLQLLTWIGKTGMEWTAPGEFGKYASQTSRPVSSIKCVCVIVLIQWQLNQEGLSFTVISSKYISLYTNESALRMSDTTHIPQTAASHTRTPSNQPDNQLSSQPVADMRRVDPRDTLYQIPALDSRYLRGVLPDCSYKPSYIIKGFPLLRYQGLQFVHMSYIYPNDYTRLTQMETENTCFYHNSPLDLDRYGFSRYMRLDEPEGQEGENRARGRGDTHTFFFFHRALPPGEVRGRNHLVEGIDRGGEGERKGEEMGVSESLWSLGGDSEEEEGLAYDSTPPPVFDPEVNWAQTFQVTPVILQRSDWIDLSCNVSGNLLLRPSDALPVVNAFMDKLNHRHNRHFSLVRVLNVERKVDGIQGSRYFLELELRDMTGQHLRLSHYIYALIRHNRSHVAMQASRLPLEPDCHCTLHSTRYHTHTVTLLMLYGDIRMYYSVCTCLCVSVKNQARWVQQLIVDMEGLYHTTGDPYFNLIITDYNSTDMDIEAALKASTLHRYQYVKLSGNFERSAGLQAGIDLITDEHSIAFLCDLHIHFPPSIIDSVRKHCVEGHMAFAPIVMRLDCGATPKEPRGYWEVNGFGLLGIYKSDLDAAGGMNTHDFTDRWGGEDWELLDRILQSGLEVERIYLRNFLHHYHSKRGMWNRRTQRSGT
uniref:Hexosyltransferase n=1 Tax=Oncorhynchus mykiss TaxID=8022 RepID=A0A8C7PXT0_ONCMY